MLRSRFCPAAGRDGPRQTFLPAAAVGLSVTEVQTNGKPLLQQEAEGVYSVTEGTGLDAAWQAFAASPFDLYSGPLIRMQVCFSASVTFLHCSMTVKVKYSCKARRRRLPLCLLQVWRISAEEHALLVVQHHAISDGWSMGVLSRDLATAYNAVASRGKPQWPLLPVQQVDYAAWQRQRMAAVDLDEEIAWWKRTLAFAPALLSLPTDRPRPDTFSGAGGDQTFSIGAAVREGLERLASVQKTTVFTVLAAAVQVENFFYL